MFVTRNVRVKYMESAGEGGSDAGGADTGAAAAAAADAGKKTPSDEEARLLKENMKRKADLALAGESISKLQASLKQFEGIDPEAVRKLLAEQKSVEDKRLEASGDFDRLKQRMVEEHGTAIKSIGDQLTEAQGKLAAANGTINDLSIGTQFGQSKFISEELTMTPSKARVIYADFFDLEGGKVVGYDKPRGSASRTALVDQYGNSVAFDDAMRKIVEADPEKDYLLRSKVKPGAGSETKKTVQTKSEAASGGISRIAAGLLQLNGQK